MGSRSTIAELGDLALTDAYITQRLIEIVHNTTFDLSAPKELRGFFDPARDEAMREHPSNHRGPSQFG